MTPEKKKPDLWWLAFGLPLALNSALDLWRNFHDPSMDVGRRILFAFFDVPIILMMIGMMVLCLSRRVRMKSFLKPLALLWILLYGFTVFDFFVGPGRSARSYQVEDAVKLTLFALLAVGLRIYWGREKRQAAAKAVGNPAPS